MSAVTSQVWNFRDVTFIAVDKRFEDDQALIRGDAAVDALIGQL